VARNLAALKAAAETAEARASHASAGDERIARGTPSVAATPSPRLEWDPPPLGALGVGLVEDRTPLWAPSGDLAIRLRP
jgi:hypothetical protein